MIITSYKDFIQDPRVGSTICKLSREAKIAKFLTAYREDAEVAAWRNPEDGERLDNTSSYICQPVSLYFSFSPITRSFASISISYFHAFRWESRDQLIRFLRAGLWDVEAALKVLRYFIVKPVFLHTELRHQFYNFFCLLSQVRILLYILNGFYSEACTLMNIITQPHLDQSPSTKLLSNSVILWKNGWG